ncbi:hypothetical protein ACFQX7_28165 [Luedemannella flava]
MRVLRRASWLLALAAGVPAMLVTLHTMVTVPGGWNAVLSGAVSWASAPVLLNLAAVLGWLLWAWALYEVGAAAVDRMRLLRRTRPALPPRARAEWPR